MTAKGTGMLPKKLEKFVVRTWLLKVKVAEKLKSLLQTCGWPKSNLKYKI